MVKKFLLLLIVLLSMSSIVLALGTSESLLSNSRYDGRVNLFLATHDSMLNFLIPAIMLFVCLVTFAIDFGTVGVSGVATLSLALLWLLGIVYLNWFSLMTFAVMMVILIFKINSK
jgi:hypothetical protein